MGENKVFRNNDGDLVIKFAFEKFINSTDGLVSELDKISIKTQLFNLATIQTSCFLIVYGKQIMKYEYYAPKIYGAYQ